MNLEAADGQVIAAVEDPGLREGLLRALQCIGVSPRQLTPDELCRTIMSGRVLVLLETSNDTSRLIDTARYLYETWDEPGHAALCFLAYAIEDATTDAVVFALWAIGPEGTVIVQCYQPGKLEPVAESLRSLACRFLGIHPNVPATRPWWRGRA